MHWYHIALAVGAIVAGALAWNVPRAVLWISMGALSFLASSWWHDAGFPYGAAFGAATNIGICFLIYAHAELRWELRVWNCFHLMIVLDLLNLLGLIRSHYDFAVALEIANWLALLIIGAVGIADRVGSGVFNGPRHPRGADLVHRALWAERSRPPFWQER